MSTQSPRIVTGSFPYMQFAREHGLKYDVVLRASDMLEGRHSRTMQHSEEIDLLSWILMHDKLADVVASERRRRELVNGAA